MTTTTAPEVSTATFCAECVAGSQEESPRDVSTNNGIGRKFYGGADRCGRCGSVVRTLWFVVADVPLVPRGSYRYLPVGAERLDGYFVQTASQSFLARRTGWQWSQIGITWLLGILGVAAFLLITAWIRRS